MSGLGYRACSSTGGTPLRDQVRAGQSGVRLANLADFPADVRGGVDAALRAFLQRRGPASPAPCRGRRSSFLHTGTARLQMSEQSLSQNGWFLLPGSAEVESVPFRTRECRKIRLKISVSKFAKLVSRVKKRWVCASVHRSKIGVSPMEDFLEVSRLMIDVSRDGVTQASQRRSPCFRPARMTTYGLFVVQQVRRHAVLPGKIETELTRLCANGDRRR